MHESGETWPVITEELQDKMLARLVRRIRFRERLPPTYRDIAIAQWVEAHPEKWLLGAVLQKLEEFGMARVDTEADKFLVLAAINLVECIAHAKNDV